MLCHKIIDRTALLANFVNIKSNCPNKKICAMVKANAYGHGYKNVVKVLDGKADMFGVANIFEAINVRKISQNTDILVVGAFEKENIQLAQKYSIILTVDSLENIKKICKEKLKKSIKINIKIDTGMSRLGLKKISDFILAQELIKNNSKIIFNGIFTHFCTIFSDNNFYIKQQQIFDNFLANIFPCFSPIIHIGGSGVVCNKSYLNYDMVRVGINLYGYQDKNSKLKLYPVMSIQSKILDIKQLQQGDSVGYDRFYMCKAPCKIAVCLLGYADGLDRKLAEKNYYVSINGKSCKIIGKICMDMFFCDITGVDARVGDNVLVMKDASVIASKLKTIEYEILTNFSYVR